MPVVDPETWEREHLTVFYRTFYVPAFLWIRYWVLWTVNIIIIISKFEQLDMDSLDRASDTDICVSVKSSMWQNIPSENKKDMVFQNIHLSICVNVWVVKCCW